MCDLYGKTNGFFFTDWVWDLFFLPKCICSLLFRCQPLRDQQLLIPSFSWTNLEKALKRWALHYVFQMTYQSINLFVKTIQYMYIITGWWPCPVMFMSQILVEKKWRVPIRFRLHSFPQSCVSSLVARFSSTQIPGTVVSLNRTCRFSHPAWKIRYWTIVVSDFMVVMLGWPLMTKRAARSGNSLIWLCAAEGSTPVSFSNFLLKNICGHRALCTSFHGKVLNDSFDHNPGRLWKYCVITKVNWFFCINWLKELPRRVMPVM